MRKTRWLGVLWAVLLSAAQPVWGQVSAEPSDPQVLLQNAEQIKLTDQRKFSGLLKQVEGASSVLNLQQRWHLRYLLAWQKLVYEGDAQGASSILVSIIDDCQDRTLRFRATATLINILAVSHRFEDAYSRLNDLMAQLPQITDKAARFQGLGEAAQLLIAAGQYDLAIDYAGQMLKDVPPGENTCRADIWALHARYKAGLAASSDTAFQELVDTCESASQRLFANGARADIASMYLQEGLPKKAVDLLREHYAEIVNLGYGTLVSQFDAILASAYLSSGDGVSAKYYAMHAIGAESKGAFSESSGIAYRVLYQLARADGDYPSALRWHEKYMAADKGYLNDVSARALAYQRVKQQVIARKQQIDALDSQNKILQLQQELDRKAVQASRLSIVLLLTILTSILFWLIRLKRSQKRFMRLARHDGLTGIFNRQHFVEQAERMLAAAQRDGQHVCLLLMDLDHFKLINDAHGHAFGDLVLKRAVAVCHDHLRKSDIFGRLGGEEFGILLPGCMLANVSVRAEAIRITIAETSDDEDTRGVVISASLGVASTEHAGYDLQQLMANADNALYRAKRGGRNRVVLDDVPQGEAASL